MWVHTHTHTHTHTVFLTGRAVLAQCHASVSYLALSPAAMLICIFSVPLASSFESLVPRSAPFGSLINEGLICFCRAIRGEGEEGTCGLCECVCVCERMCVRMCETIAHVC